jgi:adapter protein MecA 1/2
MKRNNDTETNFVKACNIISEYAVPCRTTYASASYFDEHFKVIRRLDALQTLAEL